jgi:hypothetical protein
MDVIVAVVLVLSVLCVRAGMCYFGMAMSILREAEELQIEARRLWQYRVTDCTYEGEDNGKK